MTKVFYFTLLLFFFFKLHAEEGMWIPLLLDKYTIGDMQDEGFQLTADDIYSINNASLKDAVVIFGGGCTGEVVSANGLVFTNHHCGYSYIQSHSSVENDYLTHGYWAMCKEQELPNPGLNVTFLEKIEDVTDAVLENVNSELTEEQRTNFIIKNIEKVKSGYETSKFRKVEVKPFYYGNEYYVFVYKIYTDVRLVGAPPSSIGNFGGDTDNWMWPRHTGDFSVFRIYAGINNQPADYSAGNIPFTPKKHLSISIDGYNEDDFTMVLGYPGSTTQFYSSDAVEMLVDRSFPQKIALRGERLETMEKYMKLDNKIRIQYAAKHNSVSNAWKKWQGVLIGLQKVNAIEKKKLSEADFIAWTEKVPDRYQMYGTILEDLEKLYAGMAEYILVYDYAKEAVLAVEINELAMDLQQFLDKNSNLTEDGKVMARDEFLLDVKNFFKDYHQPLDEEIYEIVLKAYFRDIPSTFHPAVKEEIGKKYKANYSGFVDKLFNKTLLNSYEEVVGLLSDYPRNEDRVRKQLSKDLAYKAFLSFISVYREKVISGFNTFNQEIDNAYRIYARGLMEMNSERNMYPDANFTMRVAYGKIDGYSPRDAVSYNYESTMSGLIEKYNSGIEDYPVPEKLLQLYHEKDFGKYASASGDMNICFIASNHTSGGNSGSPVLNAKGELIGLNFDRNWEGTMSDIYYDPSLCRNITVDIRYVLFIIDKFAGAGYLLEEMDIL